MEFKKKEKQHKELLKSYRKSWINRKEQLTPEKINEYFDDIVSIILSPNTHNMYVYELDIAVIKKEMMIMTKYLFSIRKLISMIPVECKYYFIPVSSYDRCFVAIRKVFVMQRKDYLANEEPMVKLLFKKYADLNQHYNKKKCKPSARTMMYLVDRRIPMDILMFQIIEFIEKMRDPKHITDPVMQAKNTRITSFTSGVRHQLSLIKNLIYSYFSVIVRYRAFVEGFHEFFKGFDKFDKNHKKEYAQAKKRINNENFNSVQDLENQKIYEEKIDPKDEIAANEGEGEDVEEDNEEESAESIEAESEIYEDVTLGDLGKRIIIRG